MHPFVIVLLDYFKSNTVDIDIIKSKHNFELSQDDSVKYLLLYLNFQ